MDRPGACKDEHIDFLNKQRLLGKNMMQGASYLADEFKKLKPDEAQAIWRYWFNSLNDQTRTA